MGGEIGWVVKMNLFVSTEQSDSIDIRSQIHELLHIVRIPLR